MNVLTEINENRNDPQLKIKLKYLTEENKNLKDENKLLISQLDFLKTTIKGQNVPISQQKSTDKFEELIAEIKEQKENIIKLQYENFISWQIVDSIKIIENDLSCFYETKLTDSKNRIEVLIEKVKELELLKSIPIGDNEGMKYFLITKNVN